MRSAQVASKDATPTGLVHKSRGDRVLCIFMCAAVVHVLCASFQRGQYGEVCVCSC